MQSNETNFSFHGVCFAFFYVSQTMIYIFNYFKILWINYWLLWTALNVTKMHLFHLILFFSSPRLNIFQQMQNKKTQKKDVFYICRIIIITCQFVFIHKKFVDIGMIIIFFLFQRHSRIQAFSLCMRFKCFLEKYCNFPIEHE